MEFKELQTEVKGLKIGHNYVEYDNLHVIASCEVNCKEGEKEIIEIYSPLTCLIFVEKGTLNVKSENKIYSFSKGSIILVRKYTHAFYTSTFSKEEKQAKTYSFVMREDFLRKVVQGFKIDKNLEPITERILKLDASQELNNIIKIIKSTVDNKEVIGLNTIEDYIEKALKAIVNNNPKLAMVFKEFSLPKRADLTLFMNSNYIMKVPIQQLAYMCGRSVSTFTREFKLIFNTTPHQWILKKRLQVAHKLLVETSKNISAVSLETGFEDLAHFSKAFKKEYGESPSGIKQKNNEKTYAHSLA